MPASLGPILAAGGLVWGNAVIVHNHGPLEQQQARVLVATLASAAGLSVLEKVMPATATLVAWLALTAVILVRVEPNVPSPLESIMAWLEGQNVRIGSEVTKRAGRSA